MLLRSRLGLMEVLPLGCLTAQRDWGFAGDYVEAMWLMLQQDKPDDYVIGTGILHSVEDLVETAFDHVGYNYQDWTETDPSLLRPPEEVPLCADPSKAQHKLGWTPKVAFKDLVGMMVDADVSNLSQAIARHSDVADEAIGKVSVVKFIVPERGTLAP